jgi:hypothetical protein
MVSDEINERSTVGEGGRRKTRARELRCEGSGHGEGLIMPLGTGPGPCRSPG